MLPYGYKVVRSKRDATVHQCTVTGIRLYHNVDYFRATGPLEELWRLFTEDLKKAGLELKVSQLHYPGCKVDSLGKTRVRTEDVFLTIPDPKHARNIISKLGLEGAKSSKVAGNKLVLTEATKTPLNPQQAETYKSCAGSAMHLAQDRRYIQFETKELARHIHEPRECDWVT